MKLVAELKDKCARLEKELADANSHIQFLSQINGEPQVKEVVKVVEKEVIKEEKRPRVLT